MAPASPLSAPHTLLSLLSSSTSPVSASPPQPELGVALGDASIAGVVVALVVAYVCLLGPGQAWWRGRAAGTPRLFARVAVSTIWTTVLGLGLAAAEAFSLPRVALVNGIVTMLGYVFVGRVREHGGLAHAATGAGAAVFAAALWLYWPPFETHIAGSDSTSYLAAGVHLAREHHLWKHDELNAELPPAARAELFFSVMGHPVIPPYARMPGGLVIETPDSPIARPSFFPAPIAWAALFADALGARYAGGFAPLFAALAVWAFWHFARRRLGTLASVVATALVALNAASYWAGRFPLAEPLTWFWLWAGLVALDAYEEDGFPADARLAGAALGAAGLARIDYLVFVAAALALRYLLRSELASRPLPFGFGAAFALLAAACAGQLAALPGSYAAPLSAAFNGLRWRFAVAWAGARGRTLAAAAAGALAAVGAVHRFGIVRTTLAAAAGGVIVVYTVFASHPTIGRSLSWLAAYLGPLTLALGTAGAILMWRNRHALAGDGFFVVLAGLVTALLVYAPHVLPLLPWASRRFVPIAVPAILLWAVLAVVRLRERSVVLSTLAGIALVVSVVWPAHATWRQQFYRDGYAALRSLVDNLPRDGTLLIDNRLLPLLISTPLWLAYDLNSLPVYTGSAAGRHTVASLVYALDDRGPVYLLKPSTTPNEALAGVAQQRVRDFEVEAAVPEASTGPPPKAIANWVELVSLFRLDRSPAPSPQQ